VAHPAVVPLIGSALGEISKPFAGQYLQVSGWWTGSLLDVTEYQILEELPDPKAGQETAREMLRSARPPELLTREINRLSQQGAISGARMFQTQDGWGVALSAPDPNCIPHGIDKLFPGGVIRSAAPHTRRELEDALREFLSCASADVLSSFGESVSDTGVAIKTATITYLEPELAARLASIPESALALEVLLMPGFSDSAVSHAVKV
jgi:hypothetical protein